MSALCSARNGELGESRGVLAGKNVSVFLAVDSGPEFFVPLFVVLVAKPHHVQRFFVIVVVGFDARRNGTAFAR